MSFLHSKGPVEGKSGTLLVMGSGRCLWDDLSRFTEPCDKAVINFTGSFYPENFDYWVSCHGDRFPVFQAARNERGYEPCGETHSCNGSPDKYWDMDYGGSSGLFATLIGIAMGYDRIVLAGVPMDNNGHFFDPDNISPTGLNSFEPLITTWRIARDEWFENKVRSLSGNTATLLGFP